MVDQFEEVFTLCHDEIERITFIDQLLSAAREETKKTTVVIALRADFYSHCAQYPLLRQAVATEQEYIGQMTTEELRRAIEEPAQRAGWELEQGLVDVLLQDVGAYRSQEPGALPLLSHALLATWERRKGRTFTLAGYYASGGVQGSIAETAESVFVDQLNQEQQKLAHDVFLRLTELGEGTEDTRRRATLNELVRQTGEAGALRAVLNILAEARLVTLNEDSAEVAHEALIREWQRLGDWLNEDREGLKLHRHLTETVHEWESRGRDGSELYRGARLAHIREWTESHADRLNQAERDFLVASIEHEQHETLEREAQRQRELEAAQKLAETEKARVEEQSRSIRQLRRRAVYLIAILVVAVISALFAGIFANQNSRLASTNASIAQMAQIEAAARATAEENAIHESEKAKQQALIASVRELAGAANLNLEIDPERSILLALQAMALTDAAGQPPLLEAQDALHRAVQTSRVQLTLQGHTDELMGLTYSPDGTHLATISDDGSIKIWDAISGEELLSIPITITVPNLYRILSFSQDGKQLAASDGHLAKVWDATSGQELLTLSGHAAEVLAVIFSPTASDHIATAAADGVVKVWDAVLGQELLTLSDPIPSNPGQLPRMTLAFSSDGMRLASGRNTTATVWDLNTGQVLQALSDPAFININSVAFSPDGKRLAFGNSNSTWGVWHISTGLNLLTGFGHSSILSRVTFDSTGQWLATGSEDGTAKIWDAATSRELLTLAGHMSGIEDVVISPDGAIVATASRDATVKVWDISPRGGGEFFNLASHTNRVWGLAYSSDGTHIATGSRDNTVKLWDAETGEELFTISGFTFQISRIAFSPDGTQLLVNRGTQNEFDATLWDLATRKVLLTFPHDAVVFGAAFSPNGKYIATSTLNGMAKIWDAETGSLIQDLSVTTKTIQRVAFSPDGKRFATASEDGRAKVWDVATGKTMLTLSHTGVVWGAIFSPDGSLIVTVGNDGMAKLWDAATGRELFTFSGHNGPILGVAFSSDSQLLATASTDGTAKVWDVSAGVSVQPLTLYGHTGPVLDVAFSPDGGRLVTAGGDGTARVYALKMEDLVAIAKSRLTRSLTEQECQQYLHMDACPVD
jgi:WD40 repeat protein